MEDGMWILHNSNKAYIYRLVPNPDKGYYETEFWRNGKTTRDSDDPNFLYPIDYPKNELRKFVKMLNKNISEIGKTTKRKEKSPKRKDKEKFSKTKEKSPKRKEKSPKRKDKEKSPKTKEKSPKRKESPKKKSPKAKKEKSKSKPRLKVMLKKDVVESFPKKFPQKFDFDAFEVNKINELRKVYGNHLYYLNPKIIKKLKLKPGQSFFGLLGQSYFSYFDDNKDLRAKQIEKCIFRGFGNDNEEKNYREKYEEYDDIILDEGIFSDCLEEGGKVFGSGGSCNPIYIFVYSSSEDTDDEVEDEEEKPKEKPKHTHKEDSDSDVEIINDLEGFLVHGQKRKQLLHFLGIPDSATKNEVQKAFRKLALKNHPDKGGSEAKFKALNAAKIELIGGKKYI